MPGQQSRSSTHASNKHLLGTQFSHTSLPIRPRNTSGPAHARPIGGHEDGSRKLSAGPGPPEEQSDRELSQDGWWHSLRWAHFLGHGCCWSWVGPSRQVSTLASTCVPHRSWVAVPQLLIQPWAPIISSARHCLKPTCAQSTANERGRPPHSEKQSITSQWREVSNKRPQKS